MDKPGIEQEINHPIAPANDYSQIRQMLATINLNSSGLSHATTMTNQNAHLRSASPQGLTSARVPFSIFLSIGIGLSSMVHSLAVKVQESSTPKVSCHAFALLAFEPITSTNQNSSVMIASKAMAEMQVSANSKETCNTYGTLAHEHQCLNRTQPIFQLINVSITNFQLILIVDLFELRQDFSLCIYSSDSERDKVSEGAQTSSVMLIVGCNMASLWDSGHNMASLWNSGRNMASLWDSGPNMASLWDSARNMASLQDFGHNMAFGPAFGHNMAFGSAFGHNMAFDPAFGHDAAFSLAFGHNKLLITAFDHIKLFKLCRLIVKYWKPIQPDLLWQGSDDGMAVQPNPVHDT